MRKILYFVVFLFFSISYAQQPEKLNSSEIFKKIQKLNFLGSVLYVAAHPDDENTRLISYLSNHLNARTGYLSITRGDGGQNLIGPQLRELLGIIRTQELLAARRIDGGEQFFTRANDFGYSKHPEETLEIWNKDEVLKDVIHRIRTFKPDVIINRFDHTTAGSTHGHHTSSAILSVEAFELAGKDSSLDLAAPWQPKKLFFNTSPWFYESQEAFEQADKSDFIEFNIGQYFPLIGLSNTEIASLSRSQHRSQGFGSTGSRGKQTEYIKLIAGEHPKNTNDLFAGINTTWSRIDGGKAIGDILYAVEENFDFQNPSQSIPELVKAYKLIQQLQDDHWRDLKSEEIKEIIAASAGLFLEAVAENPAATRGEEIQINLEVINRSVGNMNLVSVEIQNLKENLTPQTALQNNEDWQEQISVKIPENAAYSTPYWLKNEGSLGMYKVENPELIGKPETPAPFKAIFTIEIDGISIPFERELVYKKNDPVFGEMYQPFEIIPKVSLSLLNKVEIFADSSSKVIPVTVKTAKANLTGTLQLDHPASWKVSPDSYHFNLSEKGEERTFMFTVTPPQGQEEAVVRPEVIIEGKTFSDEIVQIDFEHIPLQTLVLPSEAKLVKLDIQKRGKLIGYVQGAGDVVPQALEQIGYRVITIAPENISAGNLEKFDAVVMGIRAYNVVDELKYKQEDLLSFVKSGGNLIIQYNTNHGLKTNYLAPFPLKLSRNRVTNEEAEVRILASEHPVVNTPNKITPQDFEGWVQERGLYFPEEWSEEFTPVLSMNDAGETPKNGSLLVAPYGKGHYIYTGLSFFREFPAGVPGAFRLFANMISLGRQEEYNK
ncbi:GlcNAc-PI de-N-acetylase [Salinimicrobium marinum]|uniref:GlcNAc-PI de-N-acetylase n=1 Tax=Salinimicrobium marinum TaxID=680283 RepID=A0A918W082_9FLAO|nr:PIG-L family deacetylase [Salinimicrobium marinum]GHA49996.1 GlcNAc-PI de-N-acetylase [Salinimicrobium marinum]